MISCYLCKVLNNSIMETKRVRHKVVSAISDEQLASMIAKEYQENPKDFSTIMTNGMYYSKEFLYSTSARGINPILKWL